jgi:anti-sigma factor RsiW
VSNVNCIELIASLDAFVDDELDPATRGGFDLHLVICPSCRAYRDTYKETIDLARGAAEREEDLAHDAPPELLEALISKASRSRS